MAVSGLSATTGSTYAYVYGVADLVSNAGRPLRPFDGMHNAYVCELSPWHVPPLGSTILELAESLLLANSTFGRRHKVPRTGKYDFQFSLNHCSRPC